MSFEERIRQITQEREDRLSVGFAANDNEFTSRYFAAESVRNLPACIDIRFADSTRLAIPYSFFFQVTYNAEDGIEITTAREKVTIIGRSLEMLYDYLCCFRVRFICENTGEDMNEEGVFISKITLRSIA